MLDELNSLLEKDTWGEVADQAHEYVNYGIDLLNFVLKQINARTNRRKPPEIALPLAQGEPVVAHFREQACRHR